MISRKSRKIIKEPLKGHSNFINCLKLFELQGRLFSGSWDGTINIWNITKPAHWKLATLTAHSGKIISFAQQDMLLDLYSIAEDQRIIRWSSKKGTYLEEFGFFGTGACKNSFSVCERLSKIIGIAPNSSQKNFLKIFDMKRRKATLFKAGNSAIQHVTFARKKGYVYTIDVFNLLTVWIINSQRKLSKINVFGGSCVYSVRINPNDETLFVVGDSNSVQILHQDKTIIDLQIGHEDSLVNAIWTDRQNDLIYLANEHNMVTVLRPHRVLSHMSQNSSNQSSSRGTFTSKSDSSSDRSSSFLKMFAGKRPKKSLLFRNYGGLRQDHGRSSENRKVHKRKQDGKAKRLSHAVQFKRTSMAFHSLTKNKSNENRKLKSLKTKVGMTLGSVCEEDHTAQNPKAPQTTQKISYKRLSKLPSHYNKLQKMNSVTTDNSCVFNIHNNSIVSRDFDELGTLLSNRLTTCENLQENKLTHTQKNIFNNNDGTLSFEKSEPKKSLLPSNILINSQSIEIRSRIKNQDHQRVSEFDMKIRIKSMNEFNNPKISLIDEISDNLSQIKNNPQPANQQNMQNKKKPILQLGLLDYITEAQSEFSHESSSLDSPTLDSEKKSRSNSTFLCPKQTIKRSSFNPKPEDLSQNLQIPQNPPIKESKSFQYPEASPKVSILGVNSMDLSQRISNSENTGKTASEKKLLGGEVSVGNCSFEGSKSFNLDDNVRNKGRVKRKSQFMNHEVSNISEESCDEINTF